MNTTIEVPTKTGSSSASVCAIPVNRGAGGGNGSTATTATPAQFLQGIPGIANFQHLIGSDPRFIGMSAMGVGRSMNGMSMHGALQGFNGASGLGPLGLSSSSEANSSYNNKSNRSFQSVTTVPTKGGGGAAGTPGNPDRNYDSYGGSGGGAGNPSAQRQRQHRRQSSNSSLDVAATIFSSIQSLEANGGSLASLGLLGGDGGGGGGNHFALSGRAPAPSTLNDFRGSNWNNSSSNSSSDFHQFGGTSGNVNLASLAGIGLMGPRGGISGGNSASRLFNSVGGSNYNSGGPNGFAGRFASLSRSNSNNSLRSHFEDIIANGGYGANTLYEGSGIGGAMNSGSGSNPFGNLSYLPTSSRNFLEAQQHAHDALARQRQIDKDLLLSGNSSAGSTFPFGSFIPTTNKSMNTSGNPDNSRNVLENFSQEELLHEVLSRRSSRNLLDEMSRCSSRNDFSEFFGVGIGGGGIQRQTSLGSHHSLTALLASATNTERVTEAAGTVGVALGETVTVPARNFSRGDEEEEEDLHIPRVIVSTKRDDGPSSTSRSCSGTTLSKSKSETTEGTDVNTSTVVTVESGKLPSSTNSNTGTSIKQKRSNSTSSLDALLSVFGDELAELDKERKAKDEDDKSTTSSLGFFSDVMIEAAEAESASARKGENKDVIRDSKKHSLGRIPNQDLDSDDEAAGDTSSKMASLSSDSDEEDRKPSSNKKQRDSGDRRKTTTMRARAKKNFFDTMLGREKTYQNQPVNPVRSNPSTNTTNSATGMPTDIDNSYSIHNKADTMTTLQSSLRHGSLPTRNLQLFQPNYIDGRAIATQSQTNLLATTIATEEVAQQSNPEPGPAPEPRRPPVEEFLEKYGETAERSKEGMLKAISDSEESLAAIHAWDRSQGLRKCHSRTVVKTRRTRAKIKAFLMGIKPPPEPTRNRKRKVKDVVDGTTNEKSSPTPVKKKQKGPTKQLLIRASKVDQ
mmetsp:Transcript_22061/g.46210  ORF Transcript_22061/g.46210 Transcript_22061/m.46210 type:complete len:964 (-) Transcript_22061:219-3110(-)